MTTLPKQHQASDFLPKCFLCNVDATEVIVHDTDPDLDVCDDCFEHLIDDGDHWSDIETPPLSEEYVLGDEFE